MSLDLPAPPLPAAVSAFFAADAARDAEALARSFSPDGEVRDEGAIHVGREAIRAWWQGAHDRYRFRNAPLDAAEEGGRLRVRVRVTGDFPGAPAVLRFAFETGAAGIRRLEIGA
ncbi:nuclear transport factor 2 family protein [Albimonas sp. CAU 1670]|uniref:nuclear transport factor 2 family protein n=1 Tax=Albimonas sp. CAU 1670 TaxID=3032599 RepID=UPI0023DBD377|nr:nuclear transport factor 2 family protein [Albimonas sp. CAU 1670]MDF2231250.1 nuclear transport factor 2 family protein [Albimonas sp. CAU 1670]